MSRNELETVSSYLFSAMDDVGVNYVKHSSLLPPSDMPWGNDIDVVIDNKSKKDFLTLMNKVNAEKSKKAYPAYMDVYVMQAGGVSVPIDVLWGLVVEMPGGELWKLPMVSRNNRIKLSHGGYRPRASTILIFLAARYSSLHKGVYDLSQGWSDKNKTKWRRYYKSFFREVEGESIKEILELVDGYARSERTGVNNEEWLSRLRGLFEVSDALDYL
ncbi:hypothetical protein [Halomonas nitroreducens]|uniref:Uncharacterized protein n=1 Tax=Halomonas nitroreducens TaxID=447425 RepID=A0A431V4Q3_9GAMM|nr:hypothetical protein [Halomonas nitroreducens]RTR05354.1 hypothetical protein EKG36_07150 [Halomonas nitroreducens]